MKPRAFAWLLMCVAVSVHADTFTVTRTDDPLPDGCVQGDCSLREAMEAAGANDAFGPADTIVLGAGTHAMVRGDLPEVRQHLDVVGAGAAQTRVESDAQLFVQSATSAARVLQLRGMTLAAVTQYEVAAGAFPQGSLVLDGVAVLAGSTQAAGEASLHMIDSDIADTIFCNTSGSCLIEDSVLPELNVNPADDDARPEITIRRSLVDGDLAPSGNTTNIYVHHGTLLIEDSTLTHLDNGMFFWNPDVSLIMRRSHYVDNHGPIKTELANDMVIEYSVFEGNLGETRVRVKFRDHSIAASGRRGNHESKRHEMAPSPGRRCRVRFHFLRLSRRRPDRLDAR